MGIGFLRAFSALSLRKSSASGFGGNLMARMHLAKESGGKLSADDDLYIQRHLRP